MKPAGTTPLPPSSLPRLPATTIKVSFFNLTSLLFSALDNSSLFFLLLSCGDHIIRTLFCNFSRSGADLASAFCALNMAVATWVSTNVSTAPLIIIYHSIPSHCTPIFSLICFFSLSPYSLSSPYSHIIFLCFFKPHFVMPSYLLPILFPHRLTHS